MNELISFLKNLLTPLKLLKHRIKKEIIFLTMRKQHRRLLQKIQGKKKIKVVFLAVMKSMWKVDHVFQLMLKDEYFQPVILVIPNTVNNENDMWLEYNETYQYFQLLGYPILHSYDANNKIWLPIKTFEPDIVFFTNPHKLTKTKYYEDVFYNYLTCYAGYGINTAKNIQLQYNTIFHAAIWKIFVQTHDMLNGYTKYSCRNGYNTHLAIDNVIKTIRENLKSETHPQVWKDTNCKLKIIYAPHHRVAEKGPLQTATFFQYANFFQKLAQETEREIFWSFKPHPHLKEKLYKHKDWGKEKTDKYFEFWQISPNTQFNDGDYISLFLQSDAMILDCYSFLAEYTFTEKPMLYLMKDNVEKLMSDFGVDCLNTHYKAYSEQDISDFLIMLLEKKDHQITDRLALVDKYFKSLNGNDNPLTILQNIKNSIQRARI